MSTHTTPAEIVIVAPDAAPAALVRTPDLQGFKQQPLQLVEDFAWFQPNNRALASEYVAGLSIARQWQLTSQIPLYVDELVKIVTTDIKDRICALAQDKLGFGEFASYYPPPENLPKSQFTGARIQVDSQTYQWVYYPLKSYARLIPPHALQAAVYLENAGIQPQAYWVADLQRATSGSLSKDPVLCTQFHRWFVGIAAWR